MKSSKQRSREIANKRAEVRAQRPAVKRTNIPPGSILVNESLLRPANSYSIPDFVTRGYYVDRPFTCKDCGRDEIWRATQQKWWYEVAKGDRAASAVRCRPCRRREQARKAEARRIHTEGVEARKPT